MKKIAITLSIIFIVSISFGFIVLKNPVGDNHKIEQTSINEVDNDSAFIQDANDDQW